MSRRGLFWVCTNMHECFTIIKHRLCHSFDFWILCFCVTIFGILHGLLLFSFCCSSSPITSKKKLILSNGPGVVSTGPSPSEGLVLLVSDVSRPFASGCSCGAGVMDGTEKVRRRALSFFFSWCLVNVGWCCIQVIRERSSVRNAANEM